VKVETGSLKPFQKTGLAGTGRVLPLKNGKILLDFLLVLSNKLQLYDIYSFRLEITRN